MMKALFTLSLLTLSMSLVSCIGSHDESTHSHGENTHTHKVALDETLSPVDILISQFDSESIIGQPQVVECKLSSGTETHCLSITLKAKPAGFEIGPWCPRNTEDGPEKSGIWLEGGKVYDADGAFVENMAVFYQDDKCLILKQAI